MHYSQPSDQFTLEFFEIVDQVENIVITAHRSLDDDSIASILSVFRLITDKYPQKTLRIVYTGESTDRYQSFGNFERVEFVADIIDSLKKGELLILLDGSQFHRFTYQPEKLKEFSGKTVCIDHHSSPIDEFDLSLVYPEASSTAELIYLSFYQDSVIDKSLAELFLLGILGDTGNFAYLKPDQSGTLLTAKRLIEISQVEIQAFQARYQTISTRVFALIQELIKNTDYCQVANWPDFQLSFIDRSFINSGEYTDNEVSEAGHIYMAHYLRVIANYTWGFVMTSKSGGSCNVSLRSLPGSVSVRDIMERTDLGGGHDRAAGGMFEVESGKERKVNQCIEELISWIKQNTPVIA